MISLKILLVLVLTHFFADFVMQSDEQAINKSTSFKWLLKHTVMYTAIFNVVMLAFMSFDDATTFSVITLFFHTLTDYFTSKFNKKLWDSGNMHNFFVGVGFDQVLHYVQLVLTYYFIKRSVKPIHRFYVDGM
jgi:hypothetical protein